VTSPPYSRIIGIGRALPRRVLTNEDLCQIVDTSDEWIRSRTGISERHIVSDGESTATLAVEAAGDALRRAAIDPAVVDLVIVATSTPDFAVFPSTACLVQDQLGLARAAAFDLSAACSGFVYALITASQFIAGGAYRTILVIGSDTLTRYLDFEDRSTCVLFGDGAGAVVLTSSERPGGLLSFMMGADGSGAPYMNVPAGGSRAPLTADTLAGHENKIHMNGREVYRFSTTVPSSALKQAACAADIRVEDLDLVVAHQANIRILQTMSKNLGLPQERFFSNLERYGNTSAASVPLALCDASTAGRIGPGALIGLVGFGAGLTWATAIWSWQGLIGD